MHWIVYNTLYTTNLKAITVWNCIEILRNNDGDLGMVWKELYYGKVETLGDVGSTAGRWRYNEL
jgi:hypothetical protein